MLTVHDLAFLTVPDCAYPTLREYLQEVVPRSIRRADRVIAVSTSTARDLEERLNVPSEKIEVIPEAVSPGVLVAEPAEVRAERLLAMGIERPYILSVGTLEPRKNYPRLLDAFASLRANGLRHELVIAGGRGWLFEPIFERLDQLRLRECVRFVQPDDAGLSALYRGADLFIYPSLYEGFGIPPLEAMACGAPVACSNNSSLPEIVGDAAVLFDSQSVEAIADVPSRVSSAMVRFPSGCGTTALPERATSLGRLRRRRRTGSTRRWRAVGEIAISGLPLDYPHSGTAVYLRNLLPLLPDVAPDLRFRVYVRGATASELPSTRLITPVAGLNRGAGAGAQIDKLLWEIGSLPAAAALRRASLIHSPTFAAPVLSPCPVVVTVHDLIPLILPDYHRSPRAIYYSRLMAWTFRVRPRLSLSRSTQSGM